MPRRKLLFIAALVLSGCASVDSGFGGLGGIEETKDSFTGAGIVQTGMGFVLCEATESMFCNTGWRISYQWRSTSPDDVLFLVEHNDIVAMRALSVRIGDEIATFHALDPRTEFSPTQSRVDLTYPTSSQRFVIPRAYVEKMLAATTVLIRVDYLNNRTSITGDFNRPVPKGNVSARDMLVGLLQRLKT